MSNRSLRSKATQGETGDESPISIIVDLASWQFAWARAVARVWNDPGHETVWTKRLFSGSEQEVGKAFEELGFKLPPGFNLVVKPADPTYCQYDEAAHLRHPAENGWAGQEHYLGASVVMYVPPPPKDPKLQATALTDYNANGQNYPFTF